MTDQRAAIFADERKRLKKENERLRDLLRWRKVEDELPEGKRVLASDDVCLAIVDITPGFASRWTHWRPLGPGPEVT